MTSLSSYITHLRKSKQHAWHGIAYAVRHETNFRIQLGIALLVTIIMLIYRISPIEMIIVILLMLAVLVLELLNTAIEALADIVTPRLHDQVRIVKDITAGMVLLTGIGAIIIGCIIFFPYIFSF